MKVFAHLGVILGALFLCLGLPALAYLPVGDGVDAVSSASLEVPEQPSGSFVVILNRGRHDALEEWTDFFTEREVGVIMEDLRCATAAGDETGWELAKRYQARLAENQMALCRENGVLLVSKAEQGFYDLVILSKEMAEAYDYSAVYARPDALVLAVEGGT